MHDLQADIVLLQETHCTDKEQKIWLAEWGGTGFFSNGRSNARGVCTLFKKEFNPKPINEITDDEGRLLILQFKREEETTTVVNIYAPTQSETREQENFVKKLDQKLGDLEISEIFIAGDFNTKLDDNSQPHQTSSYRVELLSLLEEYNLADIWKQKNPASPRGTFHRGSYSARLDYWFVPAWLTPKTVTSISPYALSDHSIISIQVTFEDNPRGTGFWRFNNLLLSDTQFKEEMSTYIQEIKEENIGNPNLQWEWLKYKIKNFCIQFASRKKRERNRIQQELEARLHLLTEEEDFTSSQDLISEAQSIRRELTEIYQTKANMAMFRSKARWSMHGEKPSAYFLGLEKRRAKDSTVTSLLGQSGRLITSNHQILEMERDFFANIYDEDPTELDSTESLPLEPQDIPQISELNQQRINRPFTTEEYHEALKNLNKNKSPGSDGVTPEFYLAFWHLLKEPFFQSMEYSLENGTLSEQQRIGLITLIPKKGLDRTHLTNWRPITLLNSDFKILSKALASRIQSCITEVIEKDQTGFIRGRNITTNLHTIQSIINHADATGESSLLLALDYSKAFDMVRWDIIEKALTIFGFGDFIIAAVRTLFKDIKSCVMNAGFSSKYFFPSRGIRQGCCCSPSLFSLAVELLAIMVRGADNIKGVRIQENTAKISQYADDTTFFLHDPASLGFLLDLLEKFTRLAGLKINRQKSYLLLLGNHLHPPDSVRGIRIQDKVKILGITYKTHMSEEEQYELNFASRINKIKNTCNAWINRSMSLKGKITLVNFLMVSVLQYPCSCTFVPTRVLVEVKKIITDFIWDGKRPKVAYNLLIQNTEAGGLKLADLETRVLACQLNIIKGIWNSPDSMWSAILADALGTNDIKVTLLTRSDLSKEIPDQYSTFKQCLQIWAKSRKPQPSSEAEVLEEIIWGSDSINIDKKPIFWREWIAADILSINDLIHDREPRFLSHEEIAARYNVGCTFLNLYQLRAAIPSPWKRLIIGPKNQEQTLGPKIKRLENRMETSSLDISQVPSKRIYAFMLLFKTPAVASQKRWAEIFPDLIQEENRSTAWQEIYLSPYHTSRDTKLQAFQYKLIHRIIPCNRYLHKIRIKETDTCTYCDESDTLQHFFWSCTAVEAFWHKIENWLACNANLHVTFHATQTLFGVPKTDTHAKVINFISLFAKHFIYRQRLFHAGELEIVHFLRELRNKLGIEKFICSKENKPKKFARWIKIYNAMG